MMVRFRFCCRYPPTVVVIDEKEVFRSPEVHDRQIGVESGYPNLTRQRNGLTKRISGWKIKEGEIWIIL